MIFRWPIKITLFDALLHNVRQNNNVPTGVLHDHIEKVINGVLHRRLGGDVFPAFPMTVQPVSMNIVRSA
uniref:AsIV-cont00069-ORF2 n=1 Tax=Apophua simplicipes ichnovirus TaxID=1329648 RepID=S5DML5_9VIRU|nr:AsIV-cont00069-ORF2 [Apophua simplicipes ichnovirus]